VRIARILTRLNLGGPARQALGADPLLAQRGHEVRVFCGSPEVGEGDLFEEFQAAGIDVRRVPGLGRGIGPLSDARALFFLRRELAVFQPELLHTHASKAGLLGRLAIGRRPEVARVHTFHGHVLEGYFGPRASAWLTALERRLARDTDLVLAVSHATADDLERLGVVREDRLVVCPPGVELSALLELTGRSGALRGLLGVEEGDFLLGAVGRLAEVKCPERAVDVFEMLAERHTRLHLVFVGDGDQRRALERRIEGLVGARQARVHMVGARSDMSAVLADLDGVICTSRTEGLPVALIEAAAAGKPVLSTPVGGVAELVAHERTGFLGEGVDELAWGLDQLLSNDAVGADMGRRARLRVEQRHSASALADRLEAVYGEARSRRAARSGGRA
jgi:glycosyltransferase involved in cell wall biosynthesis